jgi:hypothetical protein
VAEGARVVAGEALNPRGWTYGWTIGSVQKAQDGQSYGFVVYDAQDPACMYLGFSTWHDADRAAREAQGLLVTPACVRR